MRNARILIATITMLPLAACAMPGQVDPGAVRQQFAAIEQIQPDTAFEVAKSAALRTDRLSIDYQNATQDAGVAQALDVCRNDNLAQVFPGGDALARNAWQVGVFMRIQRCEYAAVMGRDLPPAHAAPAAAAPARHKTGHRKPATTTTASTPAPATPAGGKIDQNW